MTVLLYSSLGERKRPRLKQKGENEDKENTKHRVASCLFGHHGELPTSVKGLGREETSTPMTMYFSPSLRGWRVDRFSLI